MGEEKYLPPWFSGARFPDASVWYTHVWQTGPKGRLWVKTQRDDEDGTGGVREPRRPVSPTMSGGANVIPPAPEGVGDGHP